MVVARWSLKEVKTQFILTLYNRILKTKRKMNNKEDQEDELSSMQYIFEEEFQVLEALDVVQGKFYAIVDVPNNFKIIWQDSQELRKIQTQYLPPILLKFSLPEDYPSQSPPKFSLECQWLTNNDIIKLSGELNNIWEKDKEVILYKWVLFLKNDTLHFLNMMDGIDLTDQLRKTWNETEKFSDDHVTSGKSLPEEQNSTQKKICNNTNDFDHFKSRDFSVDISTESPLLKMITEFNKLKVREAFKKEIFWCHVCFVSVKGVNCIQFQPCRHVFCKKCVKEYIEVTVKDGRVQNMTCLELNCSSPLLQFHVKETVPIDFFAMYEKLLLKATLHTMPDVTYCPFVACNTPVLYDLKDDIAICPLCQYAFCIKCKKGSHGIEPCYYHEADKTDLIQMYQEANEENKQLLEKMYGKNRLLKLVNNYMTRQWIKKYSKPCPNCYVNIEKNDGCNKMKCWCCMCNFCWLCGVQLSDRDPYKHFTSFNSKCNGKLFQGMRVHRGFNQ